MDVFALEAPRRGPFCLMLGNFDGVHVGHQAIMARAQAIAKEDDLKTAILSFQPHPLKILAPNKAPKLLQTPSQKKRLLEHFKVDAYYPATFDLAMSCLSPEAFVALLDQHIYIKHLLVGFNFRFGHRRQGDLEKLNELAKIYDFQLHATQAVRDEKGVISSSRIRDLVANGHLELAGGLLGRPYFLEGKVLRGKQLGRTIAAPTANIQVDNELLPRFGVYATWVRLSGSRWFRGITNIGTAPTVDSTKISVETHLFGFTGDLYDQSLQLYFGSFLRPEQKFEDLASLKHQIHLDFENRLSFPDVHPPEFHLSF